MVFFIFQLVLLGILCSALVLTSGQPVMLSPWIDCAGPCVSFDNCDFNCHNLGYTSGGFCSFFSCCCFRT
ncbi:hypothetical protein VNO80_07132 [Phaseolus coccineus]|uniref:Uncharacterized protein n=1 Tax=Phaseolus coccineus TaxID=3886 RepID=A0AAN9RI68_PHACN